MKHFAVAMFSVVAAISAALLPFAPAGATTSQNLIINGGLEIQTSNGLPQGWTKGKWGTNTAVFSYPVAGNGGNGAQVTVQEYSSGDAKWAFYPLLVTPGKTYMFSEDYTSTATTYLTIQYTLTNGTFQYVDLGDVTPQPNFTQLSVQFIPPSNAQAVSVFHLIKSTGSVTIDNASLVEIIDEEPSADGNLIKNPSLENGPGSTPSQWLKGKWGTHDAVFSISPGHNSAKAGKIEITNYVSGDAKWYFEDVPVSPSTPYRYSGFYKSSSSSKITVRFKKTDNTFTYLDLATSSPSMDWLYSSQTFTTPPNAVSLTVFHLLKSAGSLEIDDAALFKLDSDPTKFDKGYVSLNFDDGYRSAYENAVPILDAAGFKSTQFIISGRFSPNYPGYLRSYEVMDMFNRGHEIGAHTRTHPNLTQLTLEQATDEISGSLQDLLGLGISPVDFFAYPVGAYNEQVKQIVRDAGFEGARCSDGGFNLRTQDRYVLRRQPMTNATTFTQIKTMIDTAMAEKTWVILLFHEVDYSGNQYAVTPDLFREVIEYLKGQDITPITMREGVAMMQ